jgi:DNA-binding transcriptional ArsR family regulator
MTTTTLDPLLNAASDAGLVARFFRTLGDPTRIRLLVLLLEGERRVTDLVGQLGVPQSRVSTHLGCLRWCGLVVTRRVGKEQWYCLADPRIRDLLTLGEGMLRDHAAAIASCQVIAPTEGDL